MSKAVFGFVPSGAKWRGEVIGSGSKIGDAVILGSTG
jgi:hypothetical protein